MSSWEARKILHLLREIGEQRMRSSDIHVTKKLPGLEEANDELISRLFEDSVYWNPPTKSFEIMEMEAKRIKDATKEQLVAPTLSLTLMTTEDIALKYWKENMSSHHDTLKNDGRLPVDTLLAVRESYISTRQEEWQLLQELVRIDMDEEHPFHAQAKGVIDKLMKKDLLSTLVTHVERLSLWRPKTSDTHALSVSLFASSADTQNAFTQRHTFRWITHFLHELTDALDTLVYLSYSPARETLSASEWLSLLEALSLSDCSFVRHTLLAQESALSSSDALAVKRLLDRLNLQVVLFVAASLSLWKVYTLSHTHTHPLTHTLSHTQEDQEERLALTMDSETWRRTLSLFALRCGTTRHSAESERESERERLRGASLVREESLSLAWFLFRAYVRHYGLAERETERVRAERCERVLCEDVQRRDDDVVAIALSLTQNALSVSSSLSHNSLSLSSEEESERESESERDRESDKESTYCAVLQEVLQVLIRHRCLALPGQALDLRDIVELLGLVYPAGQEALFASIVCALRVEDESERERVPLLALLRVLCEESVHEPVYCVRVLSVLCGVESAQREVLRLLDRPVKAVSVVPLRDVRLSASQHRHTTRSHNAEENEGESEEEDEEVQWVSAREWRERESERDREGDTLVLYAPRDALTHGEGEEDEEDETVLSRNALWREDDDQDKRVSSVHWPDQHLRTTSVVSRRTSSAVMGSLTHVRRNNTSSAVVSACTPQAGGRGVLRWVDWARGECCIVWRGAHCDWWTVVGDAMRTTSVETYNTSSVGYNTTYGVAASSEVLSQSIERCGSSSKRHTALVVRPRCEELSLSSADRERERERERQRERDEDARLDLVRALVTLQTRLLSVSLSHAPLCQFRMHSLFLRLDMLSVFREARCEELFAEFWQTFSRIFLAMPSESDKAEEDGNIEDFDALSHPSLQHVLALRERVPLASPLALLCKEESLFPALLDSLSSAPSDAQTHALQSAWRRLRDSLSVSLSHYAECLAHHLVALLCTDLDKAEKLLNIAGMSVLEKSALRAAQRERLRAVRDDLQRLHLLGSRDPEMAHSLAHYLALTFPVVTEDRQGRDLRTDMWMRFQRESERESDAAPRCALWDALNALSQRAASQGESSLSCALQSETHTLAGALCVSLSARSQDPYLLFVQRGSGAVSLSDSLFVSLSENDRESDAQRIAETKRSTELFVAAAMHYLGGELRALSERERDPLRDATPADALSCVRALLHSLDRVLSLFLSVSLSVTVAGTPSAVLVRAVDALVSHGESLETLCSYAALLPALLSLSHTQNVADDAKRESEREKTVSLRSLLNTQQGTVTVEESSILPLDLPGLRRAGGAWAATESALCEALDVARLSLSVLRALLTAPLTRDRLAAPLLRVCAMPAKLPRALSLSLRDDLPDTPRFGGLGVGGFDVPNASDSVGLGGPSYLGALLSLSFLDLQALQWGRTHALRLSALSVGSELVNFFASTADAPRLSDALARTHGLALWRTLLDGLQFKAEKDAKKQRERSGRWALVLSFARGHPDILSFWLSTGSSCVDCKQVLFDTCEGLASSALGNAELFLLLLSVIEAVLLHARTHAVLARLALSLARETRFWSFVASPLRERDTAPWDDATEEVRSLVSRASEEVCGPLSHETLLCDARTPHGLLALPAEEVLSGAVQGLLAGERERQTERRARAATERERLLACAVRVLSLERHGLLRDIESRESLSSRVDDKADKTVSERAAQCVESVLRDELRVQQRLPLWVKRYLGSVHDDPMLSTNYTTSLRLALAHFGFDWQASLSAGELRRSMSCVLSLSLRRVFSLSPALCEALRVLREVHNALWAYRIHCDVITSNLGLAAAWRDFLELFISSPVATPSQSSVTGGAAGSLSPCVSAAASESPTAQRESAFSGDRRSYEVLSCMSSALSATPMETSETETISEVRAVWCACEQSALLSHAAHHQLRDVAHRASEPRRALWRERERDSETRLSPHKLRALLAHIARTQRGVCLSVSVERETHRAALRRLRERTLSPSPHNALSQHTHETHSDCCDALDFLSLSLSLSHGEGEKERERAEDALLSLHLTVQQRLLATQLLLLCALHEDTEEDAYSPQSSGLNTAEEVRARCETALSAFDNAVSLLRVLCDVWGARTLFSPAATELHHTTRSHNAHTLTHTQCAFSLRDCVELATLCMQVAVHALPAGCLSLTHSLRERETCVVWSTHIQQRHGALCAWLLSLCEELHGVARPLITHSPLTTIDRERLCEALRNAQQDGVLDISSLIAIPSNVNGSTSSLNGAAASAGTSSAVHVLEDVSVCVCALYEVLARVLAVHSLAATHAEEEEPYPVLRNIDNPEDTVQYRTVEMVRKSVVWQALCEVCEASERETQSASVCESEKERALCVYATRLSLLETHSAVWAMLRQSLALCEVVVRTTTHNNASHNTPLCDALRTTLAEMFSVRECVLLFPINALTEAPRAPRVSLSLLQCVSASLRVTHCASALCRSEQAYLACVGRSLSHSARNVLAAAALLYAASERELSQRVLVWSRQDCALLHNMANGENVGNNAEKRESDAVRRVVFGADSVRSFVRDTPSHSHTALRTQSATESPLNALTQHALTPRSILKTPLRERERERDSPSAVSDLCDGAVWCVSGDSSPLLRVVAHTLTDLTQLALSQLSLTIHTPFDSESDALSLSVGQSVFYLSPHTALLCEGEILSLSHSENRMCVRVVSASDAHLSPSERERLALCGYSTSSVVSLCERDVLPQHVRYTHRPQIVFARRVGDTPSHTTPSHNDENDSLTTAHLLVLLTQLDREVRAVSSSIQRAHTSSSHNAQLPRELSALWQRTTQLLLTQLDHWSLTPTHTDIPHMVDVCEDVQDCVRRYALCEESERAYTQCLLLLCERVVYRLQRLYGVQVFPHTQTPVSVGARTVRKSAKLREKRRFDYDEESWL